MAIYLEGVDTTTFGKAQASTSISVPAAAVVRNPPTRRPRPAQARSRGPRPLNKVFLSTKPIVPAGQTLAPGTVVIRRRQPALMSGLRRLFGIAEGKSRRAPPRANTEVRIDQVGKKPAPAWGRFRARPGKSLLRPTPVPRQSSEAGQLVDQSVRNSQIRERARVKALGARTRTSVYTAGEVLSNTSRRRKHMLALSNAQDKELRTAQVFAAKAERARASGNGIAARVFEAKAKDALDRARILGQALAKEQGTVAKAQVVAGAVTAALAARAEGRMEEAKRILQSTGALDQKADGLIPDALKVERAKAEGVVMRRDLIMEKVHGAASDQPSFSGFFDDVKREASGIVKSTQRAVSRVSGQAKDLVSQAACSAGSGFKGLHGLSAFSAFPIMGGLTEEQKASLKDQSVKLGTEAAEKALRSAAKGLCPSKKAPKPTGDVVPAKPGLGLPLLAGAGALAAGAFFFLRGK